MPGDRRFSIYPLLIAALLLTPTPIATADYYFAAPSPRGNPNNTGTFDSPWDLQTALQKETQIAPGDTLWLFGGTYTTSKIASGSSIVLFNVTLKGTPASPITISSIPGQWAILDGQNHRNCGTGCIGPTCPNGILQFGTSSTYGENLVVRDLEIMSTGTDRLSACSWSVIPIDIDSPVGVWTGTHGKAGDGCVFAHLVVHDTAQGFWLPNADGARVYGCIVYYNGYGKSSGHGIYTRNGANAPIKSISENIVFSQFGYGIHNWGDPTEMTNMEYIGNISFNNGILSATGLSKYYANILTQSDGSNVEIRENYTYYVPNATNENPVRSSLDLNTSGTGINIIGNYLVADGDTCVGQHGALSFSGPPSAWPTTVIELNNIVGTINPAGFVSDDYADPNNPIAQNVKYSGCSSLPTVNVVKVRPVNDYPHDTPYATTYSRAHIVIYNWEGSSSILVKDAELNKGNQIVLQVGEPYEIYDVQTTTAGKIALDPTKALAIGNYNGTAITIDLTKVDENAVLDPVHDPSSGMVPPPHTARLLDNRKFLPLLLVKPGDFDGDGCIDREDCTPLGLGGGHTCEPGSDLDRDGDVDNRDFLTFSTCFNGALNPPNANCPPCTDADLDRDGDVDPKDFLTFSNCYNGSLNPPACP